MSPDDQEQRLHRLEEENRELRENLALLEELRGRLGGVSERLAMINRISQDVNTLDMDKIAEIAVRQIPDLLRAKYCSLFLYDYRNDELTLRAHNHPEEINQQIALRTHKNTVMGLVLERKRIVLVRDFEEFERENNLVLERTFADKYATRTCISVPLRSGNYVVGVLNFADKTDGSSFDDVDDLPAVEQLAQVLAMAIRNCRLFREVQNQARTDGMTRLANYRAFHESLRAEIHRSVRYSRPLGLVMLDVDHFKEINDRFGHQAGDYVLIELAGIIRNTVRREDLPARYGGDEITVILPETAPAGMLVVAHRLLALVRSHRFVFEGRSVPVSLSMGLANYHPRQSITDFVAAADEALYRAKQAGRDRFETAPVPEEVPPGGAGETRPEGHST
ncbi:MAG: sensor domain-containing diguanylate cyclase [Planctomycetes bacterium]|nr:sensor domain-containing diguanylate cyclase [Planctomycetota bacterium]